MAASRLQGDKAAIAETRHITTRQRILAVKAALYANSLIAVAVVYCGGYIIDSEGCVTVVPQKSAEHIISAVKHIAEDIPRRLQFCGTPCVKSVDIHLCDNIPPRSANPIAVYSFAIE